MNLGDDIAAALPELRAQAESMMRDSCTIRAPGTAGAWDEATGTYAVVPGVVLYAGHARVRRPNTAEREATAGEADWTVLGAVVSIPVGVDTDVPVKAVVTVDHCEHDPALTSRVFTVVGPHSQSHGTARRLRCVEVTR